MANNPPTPNRRRFSQVLARGTSVCLAALLTVGSISQPCTYNMVYSAGITLDDISNMESKLEDIKNKLEENERELLAIKNQQSFTESSINYSLSLINGYTQYCLTLSEIISEYDKEIEALDNIIEVKQQEFDRVYEIYLKRLAYMREDEPYSILDLLLNSDSLVDLVVSIERAKDAIAYDKSIMDDINSQKAVLDAQITALKTLQNGKYRQIEQYENLKNTIKDRIEQLKQDLSDLDVDISQIKDEKDMYLKMEEEANKQIEDLINKYMAENPKVPYYGLGETILWPLDEKFNRISSDYGYRVHPITGEKESFHGAIDIPADKGAEIYSIFSGVVVAASYHSSYGYYVVIDHGRTGDDGENMYSLYAHSSKLLVSKGDEVKIGDTIALVGDTGSADGYHLHIEIRIGSSKKNPMKYLKQP